MQQRQRHKPNFSVLLLVIILVASSSYVDAKRSYTTNNRKSTSGGYNTHRKPSSPSTGVTRPSYSSSGSSSSAHIDPKKLSYASQSNSPPRSPAATAAPYGWNVGNNPGPPPHYSATNPLGGAKTNVNEKPPPYNPNYTPSHTPAVGGSSYAGSSSSINRGNTIHRNRGTNSTVGGFGTNSTGSFGSGMHTPIAATHINNQQASYPKQSVQSAPPVGGAQYYPGSQPAPGYHSPGGQPMPGYHLPAASPGGQYYPPPGGHYYPPSGSYNGAYHPPGSYSPPVGMPPGGTYVTPGAQLPPGAVLIPQPPPQSSSGLGFGSGAVVGALGGALLGHVLTPTQTRVIEHSPVNNNPGGSGGSDDKVIIINNGPPGSVTTQQVGSGTTVITTGQQNAPGASPSQPAAAPPAEAAAPGAVPLVPLAPMQPLPSSTDNTVVPLAPLATPQPPIQDPTNLGSTAPPAVDNPTPEQPPQTGLYCFNVQVNDTNGQPSVQTVCYPLAPPEPSPAPGNGAAPTDAISSTPVHNGVVPLAPMNQDTSAAPQPDLMKMPGGEDRISTARLSENSMIKTASGSESQYSRAFMVSTVLIFLSAYCLH